MRNLDSVYTTRFPEADRLAKDAIWAVLCRHFFQRYVRPDDTVLDIGVGFGEFLRHIRCARRIAVDLAPLSGRQLPMGTIEVNASSETLSTHVRPDSVDVVFCSNFFEHLLNKEAFLSTLEEIRRVLKPGGRAALTCWEPLDRNDERLSPRIRRANLGAACGRRASRPQAETLPAPGPAPEFLENL